jgi:ArsR family transcriptional regulator
MKPTRTAPLGQLCKALSDDTRLRTLALLASGEICVCHIHGALGVPQPTASRHLAYLRRAGLVTTRRDGLWVHYRLAWPADPALARVLRAALQALGRVSTVAVDRRRLGTLTHIPLRVLEREAACCIDSRAGAPTT